MHIMVRDVSFLSSCSFREVIANLIECGRFSQPPAHNFTVSVKNDKKCGQVRRRSYWPCKAMQRYA